MINDLRIIEGWDAPVQEDRLMDVVVKSKRHVIDFVVREKSSQGYSSTGISMDAGYSENYLTHATHTGSMGLQTAVDYLQALGFELVIRKKEE